MLRKGERSRVSGKRREREETKEESTLFTVEIAQLNDSSSATRNQRIMIAQAMGG